MRPSVNARAALTYAIEWLPGAAIVGAVAALWVPSFALIALVVAALAVAEGRVTRPSGGGLGSASGEAAPWCHSWFLFERTWADLRAPVPSVMRLQAGDEAVPAIS
jgi:hypothetical protein